MKMKLTNMFLAAMAAMTIASCSKETDTINPEVPLAPGEARITLDLGRGGATTYATKDSEFKIHNHDARLFQADGSAITMTGVTLDANGKFSATVPADAITAAGANDVTLYVNLNVQNAITDGITGLTDQAKHEEAKATTKVERTLALGAPARTKVAFKLKTGVITVPATPAKRAIARLEAKSSNAMSIQGFAITSSTVNLLNGGLLSADTPTSMDAGAESISHTLLLDGITADKTMTNGWETIAYMYPSSAITLTIAAPGVGGATKTVKFSPAANKNYTLLITPMKADNGTIDFTVAIDEWENAGGNIDADFNVKSFTAVMDILDIPLNMPATGLDENITINDPFAFFERIALDLSPLSFNVDDPALAGNVFEFAIAKIEIAEPRAATDFLKVVVNPANPQGLLVSVAPNTTGASISAKIKVTGKVTDPNNGDAVIAEEAITSFNIVVPTIKSEYLAAMKYCTVDLIGQTWMQFGSSGDLKTDYEKALKLHKANAFASAESVKNNIEDVRTQQTRSNADCPTGWIRPNFFEYFTIVGKRSSLGDTAGNPAWVPNVGDTKDTDGYILKNEWKDAKTDLTARNLYSVTKDGKTLYFAGTKLHMTKTDVRNLYPQAVLPSTIKQPYACMSVAANGVFFSYVAYDDVQTREHFELRCIKTTVTLK